MLKAPKRYEVPEEHTALLRTILSLPVEDSLPQVVTDAYYAIRFGLDRMNSGFPLEMLAIVAVNSGLLGAVGQDGARAAESPAIDWSVVAPGTKVLAGQRAGRFLAAEERGRQGHRRVLIKVQFEEGDTGLFEPAIMSIAAAETVAA